MVNCYWLLQQNMLTPLSDSSITNVSPPCLHPPALKMKPYPNTPEITVELLLRSKKASSLSRMSGALWTIRSVTRVEQEPTGSQVTTQPGLKGRSRGRWSMTSITALSRSASALWERDRCRVIVYALRYLPSHTVAHPDTDNSQHPAFKFLDN